MRIQSMARSAFAAAFWVSAVLAFSLPPCRAEPAESGKPSPVALEYRTWTSADGTKKQEAAFLRMEDGKVFVQRKDGTVGKIPIAALSPADQLFVGQETTRRRTQAKQDELFADAEDSFEPDEPTPLPAIVPREGETKEEFAQRYSEHLAKQGKPDAATRGLARLAGDLEAKGRELARKNSKPNPTVLATTLSGDLLRMNDQRRNAIDRVLSAFRSGEAASARTDKAAAVPSEVVATQTRLLEEAARKSHGDMLRVHADCLSKFGKAVTKVSSPEEAAAVLADLRSEYQERCNSELESFTKQRDLAVTALRTAAERVASDRKKATAEVVAKIEILAKDFDLLAVPLGQDPRIRDLKPLTDPAAWEDSLRSEALALAERYDALRLRLRAEQKAVAEGLEANWPRDPSAANLDAFSREHVSKFMTTLKDACEMAEAARSNAVRRVVAQYDALQDEQMASASDDAPGSRTIGSSPLDRNPNESATVAGKTTSQPTPQEKSTGTSDDAAGIDPTNVMPADRQAAAEHERAQALAKAAGAQIPQVQAAETAAAKPDHRAKAAASVRLLLGETSEHYEEYGYKGVRLGQSFEEIDADRPLVNYGEDTGFTAHYQHWETGESYFFDDKDRLVIYGRRYDGGPDDYLEQLVELFGKPAKDRIRESDESPAHGQVQVAYTTIDYTFPRLLVRVVFDEQSLPQEVRTFTHVFVADRRWVEGMLEDTAVDRLEALDWLSAAADFARAGVYDPNRIPPLRGTRLEAAERGKFHGVQCVDMKRETELRPRWGDHATGLATCAAIEETVPSGWPAAYVNCFRYSGTRLGAVVKVKPAMAKNGGARLPETFEPIQRTPIMRDWLWRLDQLLMAQYFPPVNGKVMVVRESDGRNLARWFEWDYEDGDGGMWQVSCAEKLLMRVEYRGGKKKL